MSDDDRDKWDARYRERGAPEEPSALLVSIEDALPARGRALDVAGGAGRNAIWLARRGLEVTVVDVSAVALALARERAAAAGVALATVEADLAREALPAGPWDLILSFHYLHRPLFDAFADALAPGGMLVFSQPTVRNLERFERPSRPYLLEEGELPSLVRGLRIERCDERWWDETGRHEVLLIARK